MIANDLPGGTRTRRVLQLVSSPRKHTMLNFRAKEFSVIVTTCENQDTLLDILSILFHSGTPEMGCHSNCTSVTKRLKTTRECLRASICRPGAKGATVYVASQIKPLRIDDGAPFEKLRRRLYAKVSASKGSLSNCPTSQNPIPKL